MGVPALECCFALPVMTAGLLLIVWIYRPQASNERERRLATNVIRIMAALLVFELVMLLILWAISTIMG